MSRGSSGDRSKSLLDLGVPQHEIDRLTMQHQDKVIETATQCLVKAIQSLNAAIGRQEKPKGSLTDLAYSIVSLADTVGGLYKWSEQRRDEVKKILLEIVDGKDDFECAINARYKVKFDSVFLDRFNDTLAKK